ATGTQGERVAERRGQAHQPLEPDLGKPRGAPIHPAAEDERRECDRKTGTIGARLRAPNGFFVERPTAGRLVAGFAAAFDPARRRASPPLLPRARPSGGEGSWTSNRAGRPMGLVGA